MRLPVIEDLPLWMVNRSKHCLRGVVAAQLILNCYVLPEARLCASADGQSAPLASCARFCHVRRA